MSNDLTPYLVTAVTKALKQLRRNAITPRLVRADIEMTRSNVGQTINVPTGVTGISAANVSPSATPLDPGDTDAESVDVSLTNWKQASFHLNDKDAATMVEGGDFVPIAMKECVKELGNAIDDSLLNLYKDVHSQVGTAGTTPYGTSVEQLSTINSRKTLIQNNVSLDEPMFMVLDPIAEATALNVAAFHDASSTTDPKTSLAGEIGTKFGVKHFVNQGIKTHTTSGGSGWLVNNASVSIGDESCPIDTGTGDPAAGDLFTVNGDTQSYTVSGYTGGVLSFSPAAKVAWANNAAITFVASHTANLCFARDAFTFVQRSLGGALGANLFEMQDPMTGVILRGEILRQTARSVLVFDALWGVACTRPELAVRLLG